MPITSRSLWWTCSIARYVWTIVSTFQKWWLRHKTRRKTRNTENRQKIEDLELQALFDEDDSQTRKQLVEQLGVSQQAVSNLPREMGKIQKSCRWVPHELYDRQMEKRKNTWDILLARYKTKSFLHHIVTGGEKWIYFENPKRKKSWLDPGARSTSTARQNRFGDALCLRGPEGRDLLWDVKT